MSERAFVCQLTLLIIDTYSNILIESPINTNEMYSSVNEKRIYVIDITFGINESIFSGNEQQKVYINRAILANLIQCRLLKFGRLVVLQDAQLRLQKILFPWQLFSSPHPFDFNMLLIFSSKTLNSS